MIGVFEFGPALRLKRHAIEILFSAMDGWQAGPGFFFLGKRLAA